MKYSAQLQDIRDLMLDERGAVLLHSEGMAALPLHPQGLAAWHDQLGTEAVLGYIKAAADDWETPYIGIAEDVALWVREVNLELKHE